MTHQSTAPRAQLRSASPVADVEFIGRSAGTDLQHTARLAFNEIEDLIVRMHARTDAIQACAGLATGDSEDVEMKRAQLVALLDLFAENVKTVAYEMQGSVGNARRLLGLYRSTAN